MTKTKTKALSGAATVGLLALSFAGEAKPKEPLTIVDHIPYAENAVNYLKDHCPTVAPVTEDNVRECLNATGSVIYQMSADQSTFIKDDPSMAKVPLVAKGVSQGDLLRYCEWGLKAVFDGKTHSTLAAYRDRAVAASEECLDSMRRTGENVGISFEPTAHNTLALHVTNLKPPKP